MSTPHISAEKGDFAKTVLMPGDPLRAKFIADTFLKDVRQVTGLALVPVTEERSRFFQNFCLLGAKNPLTDRTAKGFSFAYSSFKVITMSLFSMAVATSASLLSKPLFSTISSRFQRTPFLEMPSLSAIS